jgi:hypothetical protein
VGLVAQQAGNTIGHEAFLPAPHGGFARAGDTHDLGRAATVCRQQHDLRPPDMLLRTVSVRHDGLQIDTICSVCFNFDAGAHPADSHPSASRGILNRTQTLDFVHWRGGLADAGNIPVTRAVPCRNKRIRPCRTRTRRSKTCRACQPWIRLGDRAEHSESGMISVAVTSRLCSPPSPGRSRWYWGESPRSRRFYHSTRLKRLMILRISHRSRCELNARCTRVRFCLSHQYERGT